jgi:inner membrane protein
LVAILNDLSRLRVSPRLLVLAVVAFALVDWGVTLAGSSFFPGGPLDETAHLLTMLLVLWALGDRVLDRFGAAALVASVAIDLDHVPQYLGDDFLTRGTPRPYSHSLLTISVVLIVAVAWQSRRGIFLGIALGLAVHLWRDLSEPGSGVALLWPATDHSFSFSPAGYVLIMGAIVAFDAWRCFARRPSARPIPLPDGAAH